MCTVMSTALYELEITAAKAGRRSVKGGTGVGEKRGGGTILTS